MRTALGLLASAVFLVRLLPQPWHLARRGVAAGVSALGACNAVVSAAAWVVYGLLAGLPFVWGVSVLALMPGIWTVVLLRRQVGVRALVGAAGFIAILGVAAAVGLFGAALGVSVLVTCGPQVWEALRADDLRGLATSTWVIALLDAATWGVYGLVVGDGALVGYWAVLTASSLIVLVCLARKRPRLPGAHPAHLDAPLLAGP